MSTVDSPVGCIVVRETVEDPESPYPHFLVEEFGDDQLGPPPEWTQPPQGKDQFDCFRVLPYGAELGASRSVVICGDPLASTSLADVTKPTPNSVRVFLTAYGGKYNVSDAPLAEHETVAYGRIRIIKVVHEDKPKSFFIEAAAAEDQAATIALLSALLSQPPAHRDLPVIDLRSSC